MCEGCGFVGENLFRAVDGGSLKFAKAVHFVHRQGGEKGEKLLDFVVFRIPPELIVVEGGGAFRIKPYCTAGRLAEFRAVALEEQREGGDVDGLVGDPAGQFRSGRHVAPLVLSTELEFATVFFIKDIEIVGLHKRVGEFKEGEARFETHFDGFVREHAWNGEEGADVSHEINEIQIAEPFPVVEEKGFAVGEVQKT